MAETTWSSYAKSWAFEAIGIFTVVGSISGMLLFMSTHILVILLVMLMQFSMFLILSYDLFRSVNKISLLNQRKLAGEIDDLDPENISRFNKIPAVEADESDDKS